MGISSCSPTEVFLGKGVLKICSKFTTEHPCGSALSIKLLCNLIEITLRHECFPVNLLHNFRTPFKRTLRRAAFGLGENVVLRLMECLLPTVNYHIFMNNYFTTFRLFNNIWATGVLNKNRLSKCTIIGDKQLNKTKKNRNVATFNNKYQAKKAALI